MIMKNIGKMKKILSFAFMGIMVSVVWGQNPVVYSTGFEVGDDTAWTFYGGPNRWHIGTAVADSGSRSLYISNDGGATNAYTNTTATCAWAVKSLTLGGGMYRCSFRWRAVGESFYDYLRVALVPDTVVPDTTMITSWQSARDFAENLPEGWICLSPLTGNSCYMSNISSSTTPPFTTVETDFIADSGNWKLVCIWVNDPSYGTDPPASVDNIVLQKFGCQPVASVMANVVGYDSVYVHWAPSGEESSWLVTLNDSIVATVTDTSYGISQLAMLTDYTFGIQALCTGGDTTEAVSVTVHTGGFVPLPFSEDFNNVVNGQLPTEWIGFEENPNHYSNTLPSVQQQELNLYNTLRYPIVALTPLLQGPANRWRIQFDVWMQSSPTYSEFPTFGPFEVMLVSDTNYIDSAITLLTVPGGTNAGWHTYTFATDTLTTCGGPAWLLFRWRGNYCRLKLDNLIIQPLTDSLPHVLVSGPATVLPEDTNFFAVVHDDFYVGGQPHATVVWYSSMAQAGLATMNAYGDTLAIVYSIGGTDTLTAVASNAWGSDTVQHIVEITPCTHVTMPFDEDFENGADCWKSISNDGNPLSTWSISNMFVDWGGSHTIASFFASGWERDAWLVTPAIEIPAGIQGATLSFQRLMVTSIPPADYPSPILEVLVSTQGRQSVNNFTDTLYRVAEDYSDAFRRTDLDLDAYAGQTIWIAFRHISHCGRGLIWLDDVSVRSDLPPVVQVSAPSGYERTVAAQTGVEHPVHLGDAVTLNADLLFGNHIDVTYTWHSAMVDRGEASMIPDSNMLTISYLTEGVDTITVVADNHFGLDTTVTPVTVINCTAITEFPYTESFDAGSESAGCWQVFNPDTAGFVSVEIHEQNFLWSWSIDSSDMSYLWAVSPQIILPDNDVVYELSWSAARSDTPYSVLLSPAGCDETVCFTTLLYTDTAEASSDDYFHQHSLMLGDYAGQPVRIAFMVAGRISDDNLSLTIALDEVNIHATDSVRVGIAPTGEDNVRVYVREKRVVVEGTDGMEVNIYDMMGRQVEHNAPLRPGVYLVRIGTSAARKVIVF